MISSQWKARGILAGGGIAIAIISIFSNDSFRVILAGILGFLTSEFALAIKETS